MSNIIQVKIPDIGADDAVEVIEILVKEGETIEVEQSLITVESDKASMEIPSSDAGVVKSIKVKLGDKVKEGSLVLELEAAEGAQAAPAAEPAKAEAAPAPKADAAPAAAPAAAAAAPAGGEQQVTVQVPDIGDARDVDVIEIMVQVGDTIEVDQSLITVESDKASMEVPSSHAGVVTAIKVKLGDKVSQGSDILELTVQGAAAAPAPAKAEAAPAPKAEAAPAPAAPAASSSVVVGAGAPAPERVSPTASFAEAEGSLRNLPHASPSVRKFARELGVDLGKVHGSGNKGRITADDVRGFVKQVMAGGAAPVTAAGTAAQVGGLDVLAWPKVDFAKFGPVETQALSRIKKISGANLHRNWVMIPHVTNNDVADITSLEALRKELNEEYKKSGARVTMLAFVIKAAVAALKKFPEFNASLDGDNLVLKQYYHIGFAADTPNGLVVPVIRDADKKGILDIARETGELAAAARDGKLSAAQMQGGCFTISSLGGIGGTDFTPIINAPEVAILGLSRSSMQPVWNGKEFEPRLMLPLSLSYDHRVIDGAAAARFNAFLATMLADFRRIAL
ncbi:MULTISPECIES: dihydrolipoyllysine-residue acetyltransferase [Alcaligenes]|jgi:pyruvate dehydrogenase E2 component (dihydrolipoamide acetyltransferase)|uniref:dihydrolipoyllysine-residue acetyltransferase n=1 Tax=Alcaligenes TaxID=507 RepID=UPI0018EED995|nr:MULTISPECIES: dihydrolipoyllysine-residue acetyltransferase [Alcaligenes]MBQ0216247.1 dihydrolipoyllysine-residue acetyltransferase [Alcaligenes faecalis]MBW4788228.1 dihydrolipoyllysine-residue acetyltransferase [Alcaligenes faecalis subsp. faecalis]MBY6308434.1 dihydrolipoyllysine-residue acetyltransferase [Alcaligenes faecalis]MBY6316245.1 dihydrolipoyllysine-residue acetyltransferase [Alcaligenes faecalis]MBY6390548.1 dihydrolipoyllysine-residue acetyltransferase [Alcaligenes faecalis]